MPTILGLPPADLFVLSQATASSSLQDLAAELTGELHTGAAWLGAYATDASFYQFMPKAVICPANNNDCRAVMAYCQAQKLPITGRGGGTSLSGQAIGEGIALDFSRHMHRVLDVDLQTRTCRVQPGVVLAQLNAQLKPQGLHFPPDPATASRATLGGMIANNSCGTRSIHYQRTGDHVLALRVLLADGTELSLKRGDHDTWHTCPLHQKIRALVDAHRDAIEQRFCKLPRRVAGYALDALLDKDASLIDLFVGSEGTLGLVLEATLQLAPLPAATALCVVQFNDLFDAVDATPAMVAASPSAVELLDGIVIEEALRNPSTKAIASSLHPGDSGTIAQAAQGIEFFANTSEGAEAQARQMAGQLASHPGFLRAVILTDAKDQADFWEVRRLGLGLISNFRLGGRQGQPFIEDACVPVKDLGAYTRFIYRLCEQEGLPISVYAHASVGVLHFRPMLDLHRPEDLEAMKRVADAAFEEVLRLGGVFSGEHGDGIVRGAFIDRQFGSDLAQVFREVKGLFDPHNLMNPGRKVDPPPMDANLRIASKEVSLRLAETPGHFRGTGPGKGAEKCNGVGACRKMTGGGMCPSYRATGEEIHSTRGRANLLRLAISGQLPDGDLESDSLHEALALCLSCKACKSECPNSVDLTRLKAEALQVRHDQRGVSKLARFVAATPGRLEKLSGWKAEVANTLSSSPFFRKHLARTIGFDLRRPLPKISPRSLEQMLAAENLPTPASRQPGAPQIALFADTVLRRIEPWIGLAAVELLESCGFNVQLIKNDTSRRPALSVGLLRQSRKAAGKLFDELRRLRAAGVPVLCIEPSEASALSDDLPDLIGTQEAQDAASNVHLMDDFLAQAMPRMGFTLRPAPGLKTREIMLHRHCHQKALYTSDSTQRLLEAAGLSVHAPDTGCCGMAGSFGHTHHDLSMHIGELSVFPEARHARERGMQVIATGTSCRTQLEDALQIKAAHWVEVLRGSTD